MVDYLSSLIWTFAAPYGACAYGSSNYNNGTCGEATGGGSLINTGTLIAGAVTLACLLIFATLVVRFVRRKKQAHYQRVR